MNNDYKVKSDLAIELIKDNITTKNIDNIKISKITIDSKEGKIIGKKKGTYVTVEFPNITDYDTKEKIKTIFAKELKKMLKKLNITKKSKCLVIGLGNDKITPDAVGPLTIDKILVTNHIYLYSKLKPKFRRVFALAPGVMGETGIDTKDLFKGIVYSIKPDFIIVVDSLAASSIERVNTTIQMTDAGINPGSGVGNKRKEISKDTLGIPVIAVGIPTVVDAASIVNDTINFIYKEYATKKTINKEELFGIVGSLNEEDVKKLISEVLNKVDFNLVVTPEEEDLIIETITEVISAGINKALHDS